MNAASIVVDVDTGLDGVRAFVSALPEAKGNACECIFVCDRDARETIDWLLESGHIVLAPPASSTWSSRVNQAIAMSSGDPVLMTSASQPLTPGHIGLAEFSVEAQQGGVVLSADMDANGDFSARTPAICRRALDALGAFQPGDDRACLVADFLARALVAEIPVAELPMGALPGDKIPAEPIPEEQLARLTGEYESGERPLFEPRCLWRDHKRREPVRRLSVAFVVYDRLGYLRQTWNGLLQATPELESLEHEVVFVDNGSEADVRDWLLGQDAWIAMNPENRGIPIARNQAVALCTGDPIVMIDPDILLPDGWFEKALEVLSVPAIGFSAVSEEPRTYEIVDFDGVDVEVKRGNIAGVWIIPRSTIDVLGFFNEEYQFYGGEDSDYGHRIMAAGLMNTYLPGMKGDHLGAEDGVYSKTRTEYVEMKAKWWDVNMALFQRRAREYDTRQRPLRVERVTYRF